MGQPRPLGMAEGLLQGRAVLRTSAVECVAPCELHSRLCKRSPC